MRDYDVAIFNVLNKVGLILLNQNLIKQFLKPDKVDIYHKMTFNFGGMTDLLGQGLIFSEGDVWRRKRKIFSKLFTHQLITTNIPFISELVDQVLDQWEGEHQTKENNYSYNVKKLGEQVFGTVISKCFMGVNQDQIKIKNERLPTFFIELLNKIGKQATTIPVLLLGKYAYFY